MSRGSALVLGCGVAGLTCALLLHARGWRVDCSLRPAVPGPVVTLNQLTANLLLELWEADEGLFEGAHQLLHRITRWEPAAPAYRPMPALAMPVNTLAQRLAERATRAGLCFVVSEPADAAGYDWIVRAGGDAFSGEAVAFGQRRAITLSVKLARRAAADCAVIEAVPGGWLFVIPQGDGHGTLQAVSARPTMEPRNDLSALLAQSRLGSTLIEEIGDDMAVYPAMPRLAVVPCVAGSIVVGDAAVAFDPLSGTGLGNGLRTAILAAAVLEAAGRGRTPDIYFDHYTRRLRDSMRDHVRSCIGFYRRVAYAESWNAEVTTMNEALHRLPSGPDAPAFMLDRGRLKRVRTDGTPASRARSRN